MSKIKLKKLAYLATLTVAVCIWLPLSISADTTVIENHVKTTAKTGGGGQATSHVEIKTIVNGEVIHDIKETKVATSSGEATIEVKQLHILQSIIDKLLQYIFSIAHAEEVALEEVPQSEPTPEPAPEIELEPDTTLGSDATEEIVTESSELPVEEVLEEEVDGNASVSTGNAYATADIVSAVNVNLVQSNGFVYLLNNFLNSLGHVDLRVFTPEYGTSAPTPCGLQTCNGTSTDLTINASSTAEISNSVLVRSSTGENEAEGADASIATGDAYAGANVVNIANTNIVDSNYLLFAFNNFGGWNGDLILPNSDFFSTFFSGKSSSSNVSADNSANIENDVSVSADTGSNGVTGDDASVETGNAVSGANVTNITNTNILDTSKFYVVFRIFGSWNGSVFNAPDGISWREGASGIELFSDGTSNGTGSTTGATDINVDNNANIANNVEVIALTGENRATSTQGSASIETGNAYAGANVINIANTNIVSSNWIVALINIFGDWNGSVSFGQPDLWVATQVEAPNPLIFGSNLTFHTTVANRGDAPASNVRFEGGFSSSYTRFASDGGDRYVRDLGKLAPGEIKEFSYTAEILDTNPWAMDAVSNHTFKVSALETDADLADNSDLVPLQITRPPGFMLPHGSDKLNAKTSTYPDLSLVKMSSATTTQASSTVGYTIIVKNNGGSAFNGVLHDVLKDGEGNIITQNTWELGEIFQDEEITISYDAIFNASTTPGTYTNYAWLEATGKDYEYGRLIWPQADSDIASTSVMVLGSVDEGESNTEVEITNVEIGVVEDLEKVLALLENAPSMVIKEAHKKEPRMISEIESNISIEDTLLEGRTGKDFELWPIVVPAILFTQDRRNRRRKSNPHLTHS